MQVSDAERLARLERKIEDADDRAREQAAASGVISSTSSVSNHALISAEARVELARTRMELQM